MQTHASFENTVAEPYDKVWQDLTNWLEETQRKPTQAQPSAAGLVERMIRQRISVHEVRFDQDTGQASFTASFRLLFMAAKVASCVNVQLVDATTTQVRWDGQVTFPRGLEGWLLKRLYAFLLKILSKEATSEVRE